MKRIGLIADTHSYLDDAVLRHFEPCDEVWHAGDFGTLGVANVLKTFRPFRGVFGNIDSPEIRHEYPETLTFQCEEVGVLMTHIGGYPGKYAPAIKPLLHTTRPKLFICGHSHILKVMYDSKLECLHINPGAAGKSGWHKVRTIIRLVIDGNQMRDCEVIELGAR
jgi:uncharacterized protein